jgi:hypothetical protein
MTTATARADLSVIKARQQKTWASGDYAVVASRILLASELLADAADLKAGWEVLDVACGNGNATLADHFAPETTMNQLHPREDGSGGQAGTRSGITRQDLMRKARHLANRHRPKAGGVLTTAAAHLHRRQLEKMVSWTGGERLRFLWYRLRLTVREMNTTGRTVQLSANGRAISAMYPKESQMTITSTGLATVPYQELAAARRADLIAPGDPGYDEAPRSLSQRC